MYGKAEAFIHYTPPTSYAVSMAQYGGGELIGDPGAPTLSLKCIAARFGLSRVAGCARDDGRFRPGIEPLRPPPEPPEGGG